MGVVGIRESKRSRAAGASKVLARPVGRRSDVKMQVKQILREKGSDVISIASDATLSEAARLLARKRIGAVIVRDEKGDLAGILSERDVVRAVATDSVSALC